MRKFLLIAGMVVLGVFGLSGTALAQGSFGVVIASDTHHQPYCIGMIHGQDGSYVHGTYDTLLCTTQDTRGTLGWTDGTAGYFIPAFRCVNEYDSNDNYIRTLCGGGSGVQRFYSSAVSSQKTYILRQCAGDHSTIDCVLAP
jgi:hypothetical protein